MPTEQTTKPLVVITGCSGLIGTRVIRRLNERGDYTIVGLDVIEPEVDSDEADWIKCDLTDDASVQRSVDQIVTRHGKAISSVVHLAAYYDFSGEPSPMYDKLTVQGTRRLVRAVHEYDVEQFVFSSSLLVMEPVDDLDERLDEDSPTRAEWDYPESKLAAERVLEQEHGDMPVVVLRIAGAYDDDGNSLPIGQHIKRIYDKQLESFVFPGDTDRGQPFIHLDDVADCFTRVIEKRDELSDWELFLIAEPDTMSYEELQDRIGELLHGKEWPTIRVPKAVAKVGAWAKDSVLPGDPFIKPWMVDMADDHYPVQLSRAQERLDWTPDHRLRDTLPKIINRIKEDPDAWFERNGLSDDGDDE